MFAFVLIAILAMAALLIDGGLAWSNRREAQNAADTAAISAALALGKGTPYVAAAQDVAGLNGFDPNLVDCDGSTLAGQGVVVHNPPLTGDHTAAKDAHATDYVEVIVTRAMQTTFARAVGMPCWLVSARAVSRIPRSAVASCSFCSLNNSNKNHTLVLKNGATLRVDGDIYVNSSNGGYTPGTCSAKNFNVCGDGFDVFGDGGVITARRIAVNGGWETHDANPTQADYYWISGTTTNSPPCESPNPPSQTAPWIPSRVCIHMPQIADPLLAIDAPVLPAKPAVGGTCPAGATLPDPASSASNPITLVILSGTPTICPGAYHGGIKIRGTAKVTMVAGIYYMAGGGFSVTEAGSVNGNAGVMIYNSSGTVAGSSTTPATVDTVPAKDKTKKDPKTKLTSSKNPSEVGDAVTYTMTAKKDNKAASPPTGFVNFYDGATGGGLPNPIAACQNVALVPVPASTDMAAACPNNVYNAFGTRAILAIYFGDTFYQAAGDTLTQTINTPAGAVIAPITLVTTGNVRLKGPGAGPYGGLTIFQDRTSNLTITIEPGTGALASDGVTPLPCSGSWLIQDVPDGPGDPPAACGALGGMQGTIYAANSDALVFITASGLANLQVIAGKIQVDSNADARFAYRPEFFANGQIRLIE